ncbi:MAG: mannose-6-phosphate isomerase, class I [Treponema sp.]|nr:mannose-6-phosphate isomerase, class I [Treponema sp.]
MPKSGLLIDILGASIAISADEEPEYLDALLAKYRAAVEDAQRVSGLDDPLKIAILTGFLLCNDLQQTGTAFSGEKDSGEFEQITLGMISSLSDLDELVQAAPQPGAGKDPAAFFKLKNTVKHYDWGSPEALPTLLGQINPSRIPWAELWMGAHHGGSSEVLLESGETLPLPELIAADPKAFLGKETAQAFGKLPFLFKALAAAKPLSVQAHPNQAQAREGFQRENREGIPLDAPGRNYRDACHKPEIFCALTPFAALCGFRELGEIKNLARILAEAIHSQNGEAHLRNDVDSLVCALQQQEENPFKAFLAALFSLSAETCKALGSFIRNRQTLLEQTFPEYKDEWTLCAYFAGLYPGDHGIIAPLYLNIIKLDPGQAIYIPSGILHSYIHGMGIELMADSDNVLRGALTSKRRDADELLRILAFSAYKPQALIHRAPELTWFNYPTPAAEFTLSIAQSGGSCIPYPQKEACIIMVVEGEMTMTARGEKTGSGDAAMTLNTGESAFIPAGSAARLELSGAFTAYAASAADPRPA